MSNVEFPGVSFRARACALLRREAVTWPFGGDEAAAGRFTGYLAEQGVLPLAAAAMAGNARNRGLPPLLRLRIEGAASLHREVEARRVKELRRVVGRLPEAGAAPLVMKGAALAYGLYPAPHLRPRADADLLVPEPCVARVHRLLKRLGYRCRPLMNRRFSNFQFEAEREEGGLVHRFDIHWRINNRLVLAAVLGHDELSRAAVPLDALCPGARALGPAHALLLACLHRAGEPLPGRDRLIWLYDIHLLLETVSPAEFDAAASTALGRGVAVLLLDGCRKARSLFGGAAHAAALERLERETAERPPEPAARLLDPALRRWRERLLESGALAGWRERGAYFVEALFPPVVENDPPFLVRLAGGLRRLLERSG